AKKALPSVLGILIGSWIQFNSSAKFKLSSPSISYDWETGQELVIIDTGNGILIRPITPFPVSALSDVAGSLAYSGTAHSP
ncbi:MAG: hypothetical protein CTY24_12925, partial [Methylobacter sp.]